MKQLFASFLLLLLSVSAYGKPRERVVELRFDELRSDLSKLEMGLSDTGLFLSNLGDAFSPDDVGGKSLEFGSWAIHGPVVPFSGGFVGRNLECQFGGASFLCDGQIAIETGPQGRTFTGVLLGANAIPIHHIIPEWATSIRGNLENLAPGPLRLGLVRSSSPANDSMLHRFEAMWISKGGFIANDSSMVLSRALANMMKSLPYPYHSDANLPRWKVLDSKVALRYFPRFYTREIAMEKFGDSDYLQEMLLSCEITVEIPRRLFFIKFPHRYKLRITGLPLRLAERTPTLP